MFEEVITETKAQALPALKLEKRGEKILFLDLDHTLFLNPFWSYVFPEIARRVQKTHDVGAEEIFSSITAHSRSLMRTRSLESHDWDQVTRTVLQEKFNYSWDEPLVDLVREGITSSQLLDSALEALARARDMDWTLIAASQGFRRYQEPVIEYLGLNQYLSDMRFADDVPSLKRSRLFYGPIPEGSLVAVLGDKYIDDTLYPENFGFAGIWYTGLYRDRTVHSHLSPRAEIDHLENLEATLKAIEKDLIPFREIPEKNVCFLCQGAEEKHERLCRLCLEVSWI